MNKEDVIYRVLAGQATENEKAWLENWKSKRRENRDEFESLELLWENSFHPENPEKSDPRFYDDLSRIKAQVAARTIAKRKAANNIIIASVLGVLVLTLAIVLAIGRLSQPPPIRFENELVGQVIEKIEKEYGIEIAVDGKEVLDCRFTGIFHRQQEVPKIIEALASALDLEYEAQSLRKYTLNGPGCHP